MKEGYPDPHIRKRATKLMTEATGEWEEFEVRTKKGGIRIQQWSNIRLSDDTLIGIGLDVTERKASEAEVRESRQLLQKTFESLKESVIILDADTRVITNCNSSTFELFGYSRDEIIGHSTEKLHVSEEKYKEFGERSLRQLDENGVFQTEYMMRKKDGSYFYSDHTVTQVKNEKGEVDKIVSVVRDITEQKKMEKKLEKDRKELQKVYDNIPVLINLHNKNGQVYRVNKFFENTTGYNNEQLDNIDLTSTMFPNKQEHKRAVRHMEAADGSWKDFKLTTAEGEVIDTTWTNVEVTEDLKLGIGLDTTKLKEKERILQELTTRYRNAEKLTHIGHWRRNLKTNESSVSDGFYEVTGVDKEKQELSFELLKEIIHPEDWERFDEAIKNAYKTGSLDIQYRIKKQDTGKIAHIHELGTIEYEDDGTPKTIKGTIQDITETKKRQEKLREVTQRYQKAEDIAGLGHWYREIESDEAIWSDGFYKITGINKNTQDTSFETLLNMIHPDDRSYFKESYEEAFVTGKLDVKYRLIRPDNGSIGYYHELGETEYNHAGKPVAISGIIQDVTDLEQYQIQLKQHNDFIETTLENLPIGVAVNKLDEDTNNLMNKKFAEIYGWPKSTLKDIKSYYKNLFPDPEYRNKVKEMITTDINSEDPERMEWTHLEITTKSGENKIVNTKGIPVYDQNLMIFTVVDVTAQVKAERRLAESEHNYRLLFQQSPLPMWIYNPENLRFIEVNNAAIKHYGYTRKEFYDMTLLDIRPAEDVKKLEKDLAQEAKLSEPGEWRHIKKSGELINVKVTGSSINYFGKNYRLILVNDITEQKKAEEMVLASLVEGENKERARIARELHDGLGQYLAAANMNLNAVKDSIKQLEDRKQQQFEKGMTLLKHAVTETTQISRNLMPRVVDDYGLAMAIEAMVDNYKNDNSGMEVHYYHNINELELPREVEFNMYRIVQEGLSNAVKYSEANQINIQLIKDELDLILTIDDNGKGFDIESSHFSPGLGLQTIKTRAGALGGEIEIDSHPGKGTLIHVKVPIQDKQSGE